MLSKRTVIGLIVGSVIMGIGLASLILHIGIITINEEYYVETGGVAFYTIPAPSGTGQQMVIAGESFNVTSSRPGEEAVPEAAHKGSLELEWTHAEDGQTDIRIENTGSDELKITGTINRSSDPIWFTYDIMVIISGMVIIGFSMGFTMRRPKGF